MELIIQLLELIPWMDATVIAVIIAAVEAIKIALPKVNPRLITIVVAAVASLLVLLKLDLSLLDLLVKFLLFLVSASGTYSFALKPLFQKKTGK